MSNYAQFFAILKSINNLGAGLTKEDIISEFTGGKTSSLSSLNSYEYDDLIKHLMALQNKYNTGQHDPLDKARKAIISQFKSIGKTTEDAIAWAEKYGVFDVKAKFNDYTGQQLWQMLQVAKKIKVQTIRKVIKQVK